MAYSMTGLGIGEIETQLYSIRVEIKTVNNTVAAFDVNGKRFASITSDNVYYLPGGYVKSNGATKRIVYNRIHVKTVIEKEGKIKLKKDWTTAVTNTIVVVDDPVRVTEQMMADAVPDEDRVYFLHINPHKYSSFVTLVKTDKGGHKAVYPNPRFDDMDSISVTTKGTLDVKTASPYAGKEVGLQFPAQDDSVDLISLHRNKLHSAISHGQLWQGEETGKNAWKEGMIPLRTTIEDYRFTLPNGTTEYFSPSSNEWMFGINGTLKLGYWAEAAFDKIPEIAISYIQIGPDGIMMETGSGNFDITVDGNYNITATTVNINGTSPAAARKTDTTKSSMTDGPDTTYWAYWKALTSALTLWVPVPTDGGAVFKTALAAVLALPVPSSMTGQITGGSSTVNIG